MYFANPTRYFRMKHTYPSTWKIFPAALCTKRLFKFKQFQLSFMHAYTSPKVLYEWH